LSAQPTPSAVEEAGRVRQTAPSGRLLLRMSPDLHGELAHAAERNGTSLNGYIIARLGEAVGRSPEDGAPTTGTDGATRRLTWLLVANVLAVAVAGIAAVVIVLVASFG